MNPLTSIRQLWSGLPLDRLGKTEKAPEATSIPAAELRELNASKGSAAPSGVQPAESSFAGLLGDVVKEVNNRQLLAGQSLRDLQSGQNVSLHQAMIATEEAGVSFQLMVEVRNRLLESYQELMRMQV